MGEFIVVGFYADNAQPFVVGIEEERVSMHSNERDQARHAVRLALDSLLLANDIGDELPDFDQSSSFLEEVNVVEVIHDGHGCLGNEKVTSGLEWRT